MDESEKNSLAKDVAEIVKLSRISEIWKDPKKARSWGLTGWLVAYVAVLSVAGYIVIDMTETETALKYLENWNEFKNIALANMDCSTLKQTLLDLEASPIDFSTSLDLEKQIIARC